MQTWIWMAFLVAFEGGSWANLSLESGLARAQAFGHAMEANLGQSEGFFYNPAALFDIPGQDWTLAYGKHFEDFRQYAVSMALPLTFGGFGLHVVGWDSPEIPQTDAFANRTGTYRFRILEALTGLSWRITHRLGLGFSMRMVYAQAHPYTGAAIGANLGFSYRPNDWMSVGMAVDNVVPPSIAMNHLIQTFPLVFRGGLLLEPAQNIRFGLSVLKPSDAGIQIGIGSAVRLLQVLELSAGWDTRNISAGVGLATELPFGITEVYYAYSYPYGKRYAYAPSSRVEMRFRQDRYPIRAFADPGVVEEPGRELIRIRLVIGTRSPVRRWSLEIYRTTGEFVRRFEGKGAPPLLVEWDGRDRTGRVVPSGTYSYWLWVEESTGQHHEAHGKLVRFLEMEE